MKVQVNVFYILKVLGSDQWGCREISGDRAGSVLITTDQL